MRVPDEKIDEIRSANDIVDVISAFVRLKRRGKNFVGLCPFHQEKTPSFTVSADKQMYHCFGCGKGGNVFTFVMEMEKISFIEAVRALAERAGITIPAEGPAGPQQSENEHLFNACKFAGRFFYKSLTETEEGKPALNYFHQRGFTDDIIRTFGLGYSLNAWDGLLVAAQLEGIPLDHLLKAGLIRAREDGSGHYDYFRGRAMFPIISVTGRVIAFGARRMREDDPIQGKYINSPETPVYSKSRVLYGLFQSREAVRSENNALMVEGYADLISLFQSGIQNVVASSGTALTPDQVRLVGRYARTLTLVYDADSAGSQATLRGVDIALEQGLDVKVVALPKGEDPDSFVRKRGAKEFRTLLEGAVSFIDFKAQQFLQQGSFATAEGKTEAVRSIVQSIAKIGDELKRNFFVKEVAEKYGLYESVLHREMERWVKDRAPSQRSPRFEGRPSGSATPRQTPAATARGIPAPERDLLKVLLENHVEAIRLLEEHLSLDEITDARVRGLLEQALRQWHAKGSLDAGTFVNEIEDEELKSIVTDVTMSRYELSGGWTEIEEPDPAAIAKSALTVLRRQFVQKQMEQNQRLLREASSRGEDPMPYVQRHQEFLKIMKDLESRPQN